MQLTSSVHLVASGLLGLNLTDEYDCNAYLVDCGGQQVLIDTGAGYRLEPLLREVERAGVDFTQITAIFLTHEHADHSGGVCALRELTGASVYATPGTAEAVCDSDRFNRNLDRARQSGSYPSDYLFHAFTVDHILTPGTLVIVGDTTITMLATPGHCSGHCSFVITKHRQTHLFSGDAVLPGGQIVLQAIEDCSVSESVQSIEVLGATNPDLLLAGHLSPVLREGYRHIELAQSRVQAGNLPHQLVLPGRTEAR